MSEYIEEALYFEILRSMPISCVDIAIVSAGKILLVKRGDKPAQGQWWVPGGRVVKGEMMRETAVRKAREEVGISCNVGPLIYTAETIFPDGPGDIPVHSINNCFYMHPKAEETADITLDDHHGEWKWISSIPEGLHPYVVNCLQRAGF